MRVPVAVKMSRATLDEIIRTSSFFAVPTTGGWCLLEGLKSSIPEDVPYDERVIRKALIKVVQRRWGESDKGAEVFADMVLGKNVF